MVGWVFFRADTLPFALEYIKAMFGFAAGDGVQYFVAMYLNREVLAALVLGIILSMPVYPWLQRMRAGLADGFKTRVSFVPFAVNAGSSFINIVFLVSVLGICALYLASGSYNPFIYFRF